MWPSIILILILLSALFSGSETALTSLPYWRIKKMVSLNKKKYRLFDDWMKRPQNILVAILIGNTIVNLSITSILGFICIDLLQTKREIEEVITYLVSFPFIFLLGELTPKLCAKMKPEIFLEFTIKIFSFVIKFLNPISNAVLSVVGNKMPFTSLHPSLTLSDIGDKISSLSDMEEVGKEKIKMIERALKINSLKVNQIMTHKEKIEEVDIENLNNEQIIDRIIQYGRTRTIVSKKDHIIGYIMARDLLIKLINNEKEIIDIVKPILFINQDETVAKLLQDFKKTKMHIAVVVDKHNKIKGLVTLEDVLEEIIGEISDEYDLKKKRYPEYGVVH